MRVSDDYYHFTRYNSASGYDIVVWASAELIRKRPVVLGLKVFLSSSSLLEFREWGSLLRLQRNRLWNYYSATGVPDLQASGKGRVA